ncbi:MAG: Hsp20/alpha crystallin family protein [Pseudomonadota bacterium]
MTSSRWQPIREMENFFDRYGEIFSHPLGMLRDYRAVNDDTTWSPAADITESDNEYLIKAELPEVNRKDVKVSVDNGIITITGERKLDKSNKKLHRIETYYGKFSRSFSLPDDVNGKNIKAESKNGVLCVHLPKTDSPKPRRIEVDVK